MQRDVAKLLSKLLVEKGANPTVPVTLAGSVYTPADMAALHRARPRPAHPCRHFNGYFKLFGYLFYLLVTYLKIKSTYLRSCLYSKGTYLKKN